MTVRFIASDYPGGRILLRSNTVDVGAVFPPNGSGQHRLSWAWRLWVNGRTCATDGGAKTELAAWRDFMHRAGLADGVQP